MSYYQQWRKVLSASVLDRFLLRVQTVSDTSAVGCKKVEGVWTVWKEETDRAAKAVMFMQAEAMVPAAE